MISLLKKTPLFYENDYSIELFEMKLDEVIEFKLSLLKMKLSIGNCINRQAPLGEKNWQEKIVKEYGLESTINPRGRPKKSNDE